MNQARTALQALPSNEQQRPYVAEAELALSESLRHYYPNYGVFYETTLDTGGDVADVLISDDQRFVTVKSVVEDVVWVSTWDPRTGSLLWKRRLSDLAASQHPSQSALVNDAIAIVKYVPGTDTLVVATYRAVAGVDAETGKVLWTIDLFDNEDHSNDGAIYGVSIPYFEDIAADKAFLFYVPHNDSKILKIDAIDVADGRIVKSVDTDMDDGWWPSEFGNLFGVVPTQDYALLLCSRKDGNSDCVCVSMEDGSTVSSRQLEGLPMDLMLYHGDDFHEDWFVATYKAGADDETPGTMHYARIEKAGVSEGDAGRSWSVELPMSHGWSNKGLSRSLHSTLVHNYRNTPSALQLGEYIYEEGGGGSVSAQLVLAADRDIYTIDADSGKTVGHEVADATIVGYQWGSVNDKPFPYLVYADGGIDPFMVSKGSSQKSLMDPLTEVDGDPLYLYKLHDDLLLQQSSTNDIEGYRVGATVSANSPSLVKLIGNSNDEDKAITSIKPSENKVINQIGGVLPSARGDYLCVREVPNSENDSGEGSSDDNAAPIETSFTLYETQGWQEQARCEIAKSIDRILGVTADGTYVIWQEKLQPGKSDGPVWQTELATGKSELLPGLDADAGAHYAVSLPDAESRSVLVAVLSYEEGEGRPYTARLYRDTQCIAEMPLSLEADKDCIFFDTLKRKSPLALSEGGVLAFSYKIDKQKIMDIFVNLLDQTVCMVENPIASNSPASVCLSKDGAKCATADSDGVVRIRDTRDGSLTCSYTLPGSNLRGLSFIADDGLLAMYTTDYQLITIDAGSDKTVSETSGLRSAKYEAYLDTFSMARNGTRQAFELTMSISPSYHDISIYETGHDLILCTPFGEGCIIDRESMTVRGYVPNIVGYSASAGTVFVKCNGSIFAYPVFSLKDLVAEGEELLSDYSPSSTGE